LVVEDNYLNQDMLRRMVELLKHECRVVSNGLEAYELCLKEKFDIIFMDLMMPVMGGLEATELIRKNGVNSCSKIVALTANLYAEENFLDRGFDSCLSKPLTLKTLRALLEENYEKCQD